MSRVSARQAIAPRLIEDWFKDALEPNQPSPQRSDFEKLAEVLRKALNKANNEALRQAGNVPLRHLKELSPKEELQRKIDAVVNAAIDLEKFAGPVLRTPKGDLALTQFYTNLRMVKSIHASPAPRASPGRPISPWRTVGNHFGLAVEAALKKTGYKRATSIRTPHSATVIIATRAINWAYGTKLTSAGFVSAMRNRHRAKTHKKH